MAKRNLVDHFEEFNSATADSERKLHESIFSNGTVREAMAYGSLVENLLVYTADPKLREGLADVLDNVNKGLTEKQGKSTRKPRTYTSRQAKSNGNEWLPRNEAINYWKKRDEEEGREVLSDPIYTQRLIRLKNKRRIKVKKSGKRIVSVSKTGLEKAIDSFRYRGTDERPYDTFVRLVQEDGLSKEDATERLKKKGIPTRNVLGNYARYHKK